MIPFSFFVLLFLFLSACDPFYKVPLAKDKNTEAKLNTKAPDLEQSFKEQWGVLKCSDSKEAYESFNQELRAFLSTTLTKNYWLNSNQNVDCRGKDDSKGGVFLRGQIEFKEGKSFSPKSENQFLEVSESNSYLEIHIVNTNGQKIAEFKMDGVGFSRIDGKNINLNFKDKKGEISLEGFVNEESLIFSGLFSYKNYVNANPDPAHSGTIGSFSIRACHFLNC